MRNLYYDWDGRPISVEEFERLHAGERHVALDYLACGDQQIKVSTVWIGIDMGFGGGPPIIFETMVFGGPLDQAQERYSTRQQAEDGHAFMLMRLQALNDVDAHHGGEEQA